MIAALARLTLFQLTYQSQDYPAEAQPFATQGEAMRAQTEAAAAALVSVGSGESLREALTEHHISTIKPLDEIEALDDLTDAETISLAEEYAGFRSDVSQHFADIDVYSLNEAIRATGALVVTFTTEDVAERFTGDDPAAWLVDNRRNIEDLMTTRGNEAIDDLLIADGLYTSEDDDDQTEADEEEAAMQLRGVTPEAFAESMADHTAFIFGYGYGSDVSEVRDPKATRYATLESIRAEAGMHRSVIYEIRTKADERGFNEVVRVHPRY